MRRCAGWICAARHLALGVDGDSAVDEAELDAGARLVEPGADDARVVGEVFDDLALHGGRKRRRHERAAARRRQLAEQPLPLGERRLLPLEPSVVVLALLVVVALVAHAVPELAVEVRRRFALVERVGLVRNHEARAVEEEGGLAAARRQVGDEPSHGTHEEVDAALEFPPLGLPVVAAGGERRDDRPLRHRPREVEHLEERKEGASVTAWREVRPRIARPRIARPRIARARRSPARRAPRWAR